MATRSAQTTWSGALQDGKGTVELLSSGLGTYEVSWPRRTSDSAEGVTSPEELIAAAHCSCFAMAFSGELAKAGGSSPSITVRADISFGPDPAGGFRIIESKLTVNGSADGLDAAAFAKAAEQAKVGCPVSKALTGVTITLEVG
jgi:osmotically inducible protein OsmC